MSESPETLQENEYSFPYHHIVSNGSRGFTQCYFDLWGLNYLATVEYLLSFLEDENFESMADLGCGDGRFVAEVAARFPGRKMFGIDISDRAIGFARILAPSGEFVCSDIASYRWHEQYDVAVLMEVYEHIHTDDAQSFMASLSNALKPGGLLYVTVPHVNKPVEYKHYRHFTRELLERELSAEFDLEACYFIDRKSVLKRIIDKILGNGWFILNNKRIAGYLYAFYKKYLFPVNSEHRCSRLIIKARKPIA
jgi:SAM-dependent methyltransferase